MHNHKLFRRVFQLVTMFFCNISSLACFSLGTQKTIDSLSNDIVETVLDSKHSVSFVTASKTSTIEKSTSSDVLKALRTYYCYFASATRCYISDLAFQIDGPEETKEFQISLIEAEAEPLESRESITQGFLPLLASSESGMVDGKPSSFSLLSHDSAAVFISSELADKLLNVYSLPSYKDLLSVFSSKNGGLVLTARTTGSSIVNCYLGGIYGSDSALGSTFSQFAKDAGPLSFPVIGSPLLFDTITGYKNYFYCTIKNSTNVTARNYATFFDCLSTALEVKSDVSFFAASDLDTISRLNMQVEAINQGFAFKYRNYFVALNIFVMLGNLLLFSLFLKKRDFKEVTLVAINSLAFLGSIKLLALISQNWLVIPTAGALYWGFGLLLLNIVLACIYKFFRLRKFPTVNRGALEV